MARCGCNTKCQCKLLAGSCTTVSGTGDPSDPYIMNVIVDNDTITCTPAGLQAKLNTIDTNTVDLEGDGTAATPLEAHVIRTPDANVPDPDNLNTGNLVKELPGPGGGIYVSCEDIQDCVGAAIAALAVADCLEYDDVNNKINVLICPEQNGIECAQPGVEPNCPAGGLLVTPSSQGGNALTFGTDNRLFAPATSITPGPCLTITGSGVPGDPFVISPQVAPEQNGLECVPGQGLLVTPSSQGGNGLTFGGDGRLWVNRCPFLVGASQFLTGNAGPCFELTGNGCTTPLVATLRISDDPCQGIVCNTDGLFALSDQTALPNRVTQTDLTPGFPGLGPFNGNGNQVVDGPVCIQINNPSPCRNLITRANLNGFLDVGRQNGSMTARFEVGPTAAGPWTVVGTNGQYEPTPPSRNTGNSSWEGMEISVPPGGTRSVCARTTVEFANVDTGRLFFSSRTLTLVGKWGSGN